MTLLISSFFIAGVQFRNLPPDVLDAPKRGDDVVLKPDPSNPYDPSAIEVIWNGTNLGFIPREQTISVHHALSLGLTPQAGIVENNPGPTHKRFLVQVQVEVGQ